MAFVRGVVGDPGPRCRMNGKAILELGSYNVNGSVRELMGQPSRYVGVDWRAGPGVDYVSLFHDIPWRGDFDVLVSCNALEHDPHWEKSVEIGIAALKDGGEIIICCAGTGYPPHEVQSSPQPDYYANLVPLALFNLLIHHGASGTMTIYTEPLDIAFHGYKRPTWLAG